MAHSIIADTDVDCIFVRLEGKVTLDEVVGVIDLLVENPRYREIHRRLHDYSRVQWDPTTQELRGLADHSRATRGTLTLSEREQRRTAVLLESDLYFGFGRMTQAFASPAEGPTSEFSVFRTYAEAAAFLDLPTPDYDPFEPAR